jgi:hypothetical protein
MFELSYLKLKVIAICEENAFLPPYLGSTLRGALGRELKKICCRKSYESNCMDCEYKSECYYTYFFVNLREQSEDMPYANMTNPNPFIIEPPLDGKRKYNPGDRLEFNITLIGNSTNYLPFIMISIENMLLKGLGYKRHIFMLEQILDYYTKIRIYSKGKLYYENIKINIWFPSIKDISLSEAAIKFITPFRFSTYGRIKEDLDFVILIKNILRRLSILAVLYCGNESDIDYKKYLDKARNIATENSNLRWHDWERFSNKQNTKIKMGGFVGDIVFKGNITPFISFMEIGNIIHIGKGCTMGMGKYEMEVK